MTSKENSNDTYVVDIVCSNCGNKKKGQEYPFRTPVCANRCNKCGVKAYKADLK